MLNFLSSKKNEKNFMSSNCSGNNIPTLIPYLSVKNAKKSIEFYQLAFGFSLENFSDPKTECSEGEGQHVEIRYKDVLIMFAPEGAWAGQSKAPATLGVLSSITLYLCCDDVDALYKQALQAGAKSLMEPQDTFWGDRCCKLEDLNGFEWMFSKKLA